jgi:hypothetical protein
MKSCEFRKSKILELDDEKKIKRLLKSLDWNFGFDMN